jgi:Zn-dependent peptidase ImmA (M78 family)
MDQLFLKETENKTINHIRLEYQNYNGGGTVMLAQTQTGGYFEVYETVIGINRMLDSVMFQCVVLHELGHALGLGHTETGIMKSIINFTTENCFFNIENYINLWKLNKL